MSERERERDDPRQDLPTREEIHRHHEEALEALDTLALARHLHPIGQRLALGQWAEALELASRARIAARDPLSIAHHLAATTRERKRPPKTLAAAAQSWIDHIKALTEASELGLVVRDELEEQARALGLWQDLSTLSTGARQLEQPRTRGTKTARPRPRARGEEGASSSEAHPAPVEVLRIGSPRDLDTRREALEELAAHIRADHPPPEYHRDPERVARTDHHPETRAAWIAWADQVARAWPAPLKASDLYQIAQRRAPVAWLVGILEEREALASQGLSEDRRRALASSLLDQSEAVAREALALAAAGTDERVRAAGLKLALDTIAQRARLAGLDRVSLSVETAPTTSTASLDDRARALGLTPAQLRAIGDAASSVLGARAKDEE